MEETWEFTAVSDDAPFRHNWSGKHVRLKYQMVVASLVFSLSAAYKIDGLTFLGIISFRDIPDQSLVLLAVGLFAVFSLTAFLIRTSFEWPEKQTYLKEFYSTFGNFKKTLKKQHKYFSKNDVLDIINEANKLHEKMLFKGNKRKSFEIEKANYFRKKLSRPCDEILTSANEIKKLSKNKKIPTSHKIFANDLSLDKSPITYFKYSVDELISFDTEHEFSFLYDGDRDMLSLLTIESLDLVREEIIRLRKLVGAKNIRMIFSKVVDSFEYFFLSIFIPLATSLLLIGFGAFSVVKLAR